MATIPQLRLLLADPSGATEILSDADYQVIIDLEPNVYLAASVGANSISATFAQQVDTTDGPVKMGLEKIFDHYNQLSKDYKQLASAGKGNDDPSSGGDMGLPVLTGSILSEIQAAREDTDRRQESFYRGMNDNPKGSEYNYWRDY